MEAAKSLQRDADLDVLALPCDAGPDRKAYDEDDEQALPRLVREEERHSGAGDADKEQGDHVSEDLDRLRDPREFLVRGIVTHRTSRRWGRCACAKRCRGATGRS